MILTYDAVDREGRHTSDAIEAAGPKEAVGTLRQRGLYVTTIQEAEDDRAATATPASRFDGAAGVRMPVKTLALFTRQMAMLLRAGTGLVPAIVAIKRQMKRRAYIELLETVVADLEEGMTTTEAFRKHPRTFDSVYCSILAAGEASGKLAEMFDRLSEIVGKRRLMRKKILGALAYPALLIMMSGSIINVLLFFVLPRFAGMFEQLRIDPPASTKFLLAIGVLLRTRWYLLLAGAVVVAIVVTFLLKSAKGRQWLADVQIRIPLFGTLRSRLIQGRIFRMMGMLLESGVNLLDTLDLARESTRNRRFQKMFDSSEESVTTGGNLAGALERSRLFEPYLCQAVRTGEESGGLGGGLSYCADILDESNEELVGAITRLLEPAILILMGGVVGSVAVSLFLPLFDMTAAMQ